MLGAASGAVAGLVAVTPAAGFVGPMGAIVIGLIAGLVCLWGVGGLKRMLGADDAFDVFGVHGVGGIVGAILTGVFACAKPGRHRRPDPRHLCHGRPGLDPDQERALITMVWSGVVAFIAYKIADLLIGLRVTEEEEREGLDITSHGETAYNR
jgi:Amt family ammonium transporter